MDPAAAAARLARWIDRLVDEEHADRRERVLVRAALEAAGAAGAALWRRDGADWSPRVGAGVPNGLPGALQVRAVASGQLAGRLPPDRAVRVHGPLALTLVGVSSDDDLAPLDALLTLAVLLADAAPGSEDGPAGPLPSVA